jgi:hypothetical protein
MPEVERVHLDAVDGADARVLRRVLETDRAVEAVRVRERERIHPSLDRCGDELFNIGCAIEE